jgi:DNA-binding response OmpR family regulator
MAPSEHAVLIVEDDPDALLLLQRALSKARLISPVRIAVDGDQAVEYLSSRDSGANPLPCLVLLNLKLPRRSGLEVLEWMRRRRGLRLIPVIIISTSGEEQDRALALRLGARDYQIKPIDGGGLHRLARRIATYLRLFRERICAVIERDLKDVSVS